MRPAAVGILAPGSEPAGFGNRVGFGADHFVKPRIHSVSVPDIYRFPLSICPRIVYNHWANNGITLWSF